MFPSQKSFRAMLLITTTALLGATGCSDGSVATPDSTVISDSRSLDGKVTPDSGVTSDGKVTPDMAANVDMGGNADHGSSADMGGAFTLQGKLVPASGATVPANSKVMLLWDVAAGSPDYSYKFGEAKVTGNTYKLTLSGPPPTAALNFGEVGVAYIILTRATFVQPAGKVTDSKAVGAAMLGGAEQHVVIRKTPNLKHFSNAWVGSFPVGLSCGKVAGKTGSFVTFVPVSGTGVDLTVSTKVSLPNWS